MFPTERSQEFQDSVERRFRDRVRRLLEEGGAKCDFGKLQRSFGHAMTDVPPADEFDEVCELFQRRSNRALPRRSMISRGIASPLGRRGRANVLSEISATASGRPSEDVRRAIRTPLRDARTACDAAALRRGDVDADGKTDIGDPILALADLFQAGTTPRAGERPMRIRVAR